MFIMPICYHPTTLLSVDDDKGFLEFLSMKFEDKLPVLCFNSPEKAIEYIKNKHHFLPFTTRCMNELQETVKFDLMSLRQEFMNRDRFKAIFTVGTDYDMPGISGLELIKTMEFPPEVSQHSQIIITGKVSDDFKNKVGKMGLSQVYIRKDDPDYLSKLLQLVKNRTQKIFQWYSYIPARLLSRNPNEKTAFLFDGNFSNTFNSYIEENDICEFYLFDKQGSYIFLDANANLSWLFIRNDIGIENSIKYAIEHGAPPAIIDALKSKKYILSLYEKEDFELRKKIDWEKYLVPATVFESNAQYLGFFPNLITDPKNSTEDNPKYYYGFTKDFPEHGIKQEEILSYNAFLEEQE